MPFVQRVPPQGILIGITCVPTLQHLQVGGKVIGSNELINDAVINPLLLGKVQVMKSNGHPNRNSGVIK